MMGYIYKLTSPTKKVYIGQTIDIERRKNEYRLLKCKSQKKVFYSLKKHGWENHKFELITTCSESEMNAMERYYQELYNCLDKEHGLNLKLTQTTDKSGRYSDELKEKMSGANHHMYGKTHTPEAREKISKTHKGKEISESHKKSISIFMKKKQKGKGNPFYGKKHTEECKRNSSERVMGGNNPRARLVVNVETGIFYDTVTDAAISIGVSYGSMNYRIKKSGSNFVKL